MMEQERARSLGNEIWRASLDELSICFPYFCAALGAFTYQGDEGLKEIGTDGDNIYYAPNILFSIFQSEGRQGINHIYLHMLFHCLYLHLAKKEGCDTRLWNLSCDIAAEYLTDHLPGQEKSKHAACKQEIYSLLEDRLSAIHANSIYSFLLCYGEEIFDSEEKLRQWEKFFFVDAHDGWEKPLFAGGVEGVHKKWERILAYTSQSGNASSRRRGTQRGNVIEEYDIREKHRYDYSRFLKRFAVCREEVQLDMAGFDYILYYYGLIRYKNMPLIEPLEYQEVHKLEEIVIAIDTSSSCSRDMVRRFMEETYAIFSEKENFFRRMNVYIIQCDCYVQHVAHIRCEEDWKVYMKTLHIHGRGGTDFRPVFSYVEELREKKELKDIKALLYFTDGDGIYPRKAPDYETAFLFLEEKDEGCEVPSWAVKLIIGDALV